MKRRKDAGIGKKLPDAVTLNRLHWFDEKTISEIAEVYGCTRSAVCYALKRYGIPSRKWCNHAALCKCGRPTCRAKRKNRRSGKIEWYYTIYCAVCLHQSRKDAVNKYQRLHKGYKRRYKVKPATGRMKLIASDPEPGYYGPTKGIWKKKKSGKYGPMVMQLEQGRSK